MSAKKLSGAEPLIGAHMSTSGGMDQAPARGSDVGCRCIQIFTKSNMQWAARPLEEKEIQGFRDNCDKLGIWPVVAHNSYLINLSAADEALALKSLDSLVMEMERCRALGLPSLIMHPGSHADTQAGLRLVAEALNRVIERTKDSPVKVLLETTAGQGTNLGHRFEELAEIIGKVECQERMGVCMDTCHVFAAGYDLRTPEVYARTMAEFDKVIGLKRLQAFHFNDAKQGLGSRIDRHEHIGEGHLGTGAFRLILKDSRFAKVPKVLETPKGMKGEEDWDAVSLKLLRKLAAS